MPLLMGPSAGPLAVYSSDPEYSRSEGEAYYPEYDPNEREPTGYWEQGVPQITDRDPPAYYSYSDEGEQAESSTQIFAQISQRRSEGVVRTRDNVSPRKIHYLRKVVVTIRLQKNNPGVGLPWRLTYPELRLNLPYFVIGMRVVFYPLTRPPGRSTTDLK